MKPEEVVAKVCGVEPFTINDATSNSNLAEWDSMAHVILVMELENTYGVKLSVDQALTLTSVGLIKTFLGELGVTW